jgi:hypothetical protein
MNAQPVCRGLGSEGRVRKHPYISGRIPGMGPEGLSRRRIGRVHPGGDRSEKVAGMIGFIERFSLLFPPLRNVQHGNSFRQTLFWLLKPESSHRLTTVGIG